MTHPIAFYSSALLEVKQWIIGGTGIIAKSGLGVRQTCGRISMAYWFYELGKFPQFIEVQFAAAAAAAMLLQSCPTLCDPVDGSPPGSPIPGILQARTLEWVAISFSNAWKWKVKVKSLSCVQLLATPRTAAYQALPPMGFSRQEYWNGVPLPSP